MCVQDAQIIELEDSKELIMVDGFFPTDLQQRTQEMIVIIVFILFSFSCGDKKPRNVEPSHTMQLN